MIQKTYRVRIPEGITPGMVGVFLGGVLAIAAMWYYDVLNPGDYFKIVALIGCWVALLDMRRANSIARTNDKERRL